MTSPLPDTIERTIRIEAPVDRVWNLISTPGWWINEGEVVDHELRYSQDQRHVVVVAPPLGEFSLEIVELDEPRYAAFRWLSGTADDEQPLGTLVEFTITPVRSAVEVTVVESGWASLEPTPFARSNFAENESGWETEMAAAQCLLTA